MSAGRGGGAAESFHLESLIEVLESTPRVLDEWLRGLDEAWIRSDEGPESFSAFDVVGHLIQGEMKDWIPRIKVILRGGGWPVFEPFDRFAQLEADRGRAMSDLLDEFSRLRRQNIETLRDLELGAEELDLVGVHPDLGEVSMRQLLATWTVHDLGHIGQIARVMAKRYGADTGPWKAHLPVLRDRSRE